ncbi:MAG: hypothetical protein PUC65_03275 [Clostridiales bacterium]|nr:hypothetical protein [Clostridiales bacterium]
MSFHNYKITFSWIGLLAILIPMIPNIIWAVLSKESDFITIHNVERPILDPVEKGFQMIMP